MNGNAWKSMIWMEMNEMHDSEWKIMEMNELDGNE